MLVMPGLDDKLGTALKSIEITGTSPVMTIECDFG